MSDISIPAKGLYSGSPDFGADAPPRLHQSIAAEMLNRSPLHAWHKAFGKKEPEEYDRRKTLGSIAHALLFGGKDIVPIAAENWRTNAAKEARDGAIAAGKLPILAAEYEEAQMLVRIATEKLAERSWARRANSRQRMPLLLTGQSEITAIWSSRIGRVLCEGRIDHLIVPPPRSRKTLRALILDFKFCNSADRKTCENKFVDYGYDIQEAAYREAVETIFPKLAGRVDSLYIFIETEAPYAVRVMPLAGSMRASGEYRWAKACELWGEYLKRYGMEKPWPEFEDDFAPAELPAWALRDQAFGSDHFEPEAA